MKKIYNFNKFNILNEAGSDFNQFSQGGSSPHSLGPGYGFAVDPSLSIYGGQDSPYTDPYSRTPMYMNNLMGIMKNLNKDTLGTYGGIKYDQFLEDVDKYTNLRILRMNRNDNLTIDVYIAFDFDGDEHFGVYKKFNWVEKSKLHTDLYTDSDYKYIDGAYKLKLDNYISQILTNWFKPQKSQYVCLNKHGVSSRDKMGNQFMLPKNSTIQVIHANVDKDGNSYITYKFKDERYTITKNDYYYFNYNFDLYNNKL